MKVYYIVLLSLLISISSFSQKKEYLKELEKKAELNFLYKEYRLASYKYLKLWRADSQNVEYNYKLGICYSEANIDPQAAIKCLNYVQKNDKSNKDVLFYIARTKMNLYKFSEAIDLFKSYKVTQGADKKLVLNVDRLIAMCYNALEIMNSPLNVSFENLGKDVNSRLDDYNAFVVDDEGFVTFTSNKKYDADYGTYISNVYVSESSKGKWGRAVPQMRINTTDDETTVWMSDDGKVLFICNSMDEEYSDILRAERKGKYFKYYDKEEKFFKRVNSKAIDDGASMTDDGNAIYVSSSRNGGLGDRDIYVIRKLPNGKWGVPENLGDIINTKSDDAYPSISGDGRTLYFASKGHNSIGGYDLFVSYWNVTRQEWTNPINLGYPINTTQDNLTISFPTNTRYAYIAANRKEGFGGLDVYRVTFHDIDEELALIKGHVFLGDSITGKKFEGDHLDLEITVFDALGNLFGIYLPKKNTGDFVAILPKGKYDMEILYNDNYKMCTEKIIIHDKADFVKEQDKNFYLIQK